MNNYTVNKLNELIRNTAAKLGYNVDIRKIKDGRFPVHVDDAFVLLVGIVREHTLLPWEALYMNYQAANWVAKQQIPGDIVECGVFKGGSMVMIARALVAHGDQVHDRKYWLYDTFEGMSAPTQKDTSILGPAETEYRSSLRSDGKSDWCLAELDSVADYFAKHTDSAPAAFVKGKVEETLTIEANKPKRIAILRLDTDFYESTAAELVHLYPLLSANGVLVIDDYNFWHGCKSAVDEYFSENRIKPAFFTDPQSGRVMHFKSALATPAAA